MHNSWGYSVGALQVASAAFSLVLLSGCEKVASDNIKTSGVYADFRITDRSATEIDVHAEFRVGGANSNTYLDTKNSGDRVDAAALGVTRALSRDPQTFGEVFYTAQLPNAPEDTQVTISFTREKDTSAPNSNVSLPSPFTAISTSSTTASRASDALTIGWQPSGTADSISVRVSGTCFDAHDTSVVGDPGTLALPLRTLKSSDQTPATCVATVTVLRERAGQVDPAYGEGGRITATRTTTMQFTSTP